MSDLSVFLHKVGDFFSSFTHNDPAVTQSVQATGANLKAAADSVEAILPHIVEDAANAALALIPGGLGSDFAPIVDAFIDKVILALEGKKASPPAGG